MVSTTLKFVGKQQNNLNIGHRKFLKDRNVIWSYRIYIAYFSEEIRFVSNKYEKDDYPKGFINSVIGQFQDNSSQSNIDDFDDYIALPIFFNIPKSFIIIELPFCETNEIKSKYFLKKIHCFTKDCFEVAIKWKTSQVITLFPLKKRSIYPSCVIYEGTCSCG